MIFVYRIYLMVILSIIDSYFLIIWLNYNYLKPITNCILFIISLCFFGENRYNLLSCKYLKLSSPFTFFVLFNFFFFIFYSLSMIFVFAVHSDSIFIFVCSVKLIICVTFLMKKKPIIQGSWYLSFQIIEFFYGHLLL